MEDNINPILKEITETRGKSMKRHGSAKGYKYVRIISYDGEKTYRAEIAELNVCRSFSNARDAALHVDIAFLNAGKNPVNILKKKQS